MSTATMNPAVDTQGANLARETVCIAVSFGLLGNSKKVANSAVEVDADKSLIKVSKQLLESKELDAIRKADGELRRYLYDMCLPFDIGIYLLPVKLIPMVDNKLRQYQGDREILVENFLAVYSSLCRTAEENLRSLFNPRDYPPESVVRSKFSFQWRYISFGTPEALKAISAGMFEEERTKAAQRMEEASSEITAVMRSTMAELVSHLRDRLTPGADGKPKILRDTAVTNLTDFLKTFDLRNVTNDTDLAETVAKCRKILADTPDMEVLRNVASYRAKVQSDMNAISQELDKLVAEKPSRKFRLDD
jgi:hypothetical protein